MIIITDKARQKLIEVLNEEKAKIVRFGLQGGGCSGFQYFFAVEEKQDEEDTVYTLAEDLILVIDSMSGMYLENAEIDYKKDLMGESFVFKNPNSTGKCGCGSSVAF